MIKRWVLVGLCLLAAACPGPATLDGGQDAGSRPDGGNDAGIADAGGDDDGGDDAGLDAGADGGMDAGSDSGTDAGEDGGNDAGTDAGSDGGLDAGIDGGPDGGGDAGFDAGFAGPVGLCLWPDGGVVDGGELPTGPLGQLMLGTLTDDVYPSPYSVGRIGDGLLGAFAIDDAGVPWVVMSFGLENSSGDGGWALVALLPDGGVASDELHLYSPPFAGAVAARIGRLIFDQNGVRHILRGGVASGYGDYVRSPAPGVFERWSFGANGIDLIVDPSGAAHLFFQSYNIPNPDGGPLGSGVGRYDWLPDAGIPSDGGTLYLFDGVKGEADLITAARSIDGTLSIAYRAFHVTAPLGNKVFWDEWGQPAQDTGYTDDPWDYTVRFCTPVIASHWGFLTPEAGVWVAQTAPIGPYGYNLMTDSNGNTWYTGLQDLVSITTMSNASTSLTNPLYTPILLAFDRDGNPHVVYEEISGVVGTIHHLYWQ